MAGCNFVYGAAARPKDPPPAAAAAAAASRHRSLRFFFFAACVALRCVASLCFYLPFLARFSSARFLMM